MSENKCMTLEEYNKMIVRPMVLNGIKSGQFDVVLKNIEERSKCISIYSKDMEIIIAIVNRFNELNKE